MKWNSNVSAENVLELDMQKKKRLDMQKAYKDSLDAQIAQSRQLQQYGKMSHIEKRMNRADLHAFKTYDTNEYSVVPGLNS